MLVRFGLGICLGLLLAGAFAVAEGCSSFSPDDPSSPLPASEAGLDATTTDKTDANVPTDATTTFCAMQPAGAFCTDFETLPLDAGFEDLFSTEGSFTLLDGGAPASPLHAFQATTPPATGSPPPSSVIGMNDAGLIYAQAATMLRSFTASSVGRLVFDADVRVDDLPPADASRMISSFILSGTASNADDQSVVLAFGRNTTGGFSGVVGVNGDTKTIEPFIITKGFGEWFHVQVIVDRAQNGSASVLIDGTFAGGVSPTTLFQNRSFFKLGIGLVRERGDGNTAISFDNVVLVSP